MVVGWALPIQLVTSSAEFETLWKTVVSVLTEPCRTSKNIGMFFGLLRNAKGKSFSPDSLRVGMTRVDCLLADLPTNL